MTGNIPHMATIKETAKIFGLSEYFVRQTVLSGKVVAVKAGVKYLVNLDKFAEYLNTGDNTGTESVKLVSGIYPIPRNFR